jgi:hypothetical protein
MLLVREVFYAKPGQAGKLARLMREVMSAAYPNGNIRIMTDYISEFNKVVMETELADLAAFEARMDSSTPPSRTCTEPSVPAIPTSSISARAASRANTRHLK